VPCYLCSRVVESDVSPLFGVLLNDVCFVPSHLLHNVATLITVRFADEIQAMGGGAPFCVEVVRDGVRVGILRGTVSMKSLVLLTTQVRRSPRALSCVVPPIAHMHVTVPGGAEEARRPYLRAAKVWGAYAQSLLRAMRVCVLVRGDMSGCQSSCVLVWLCAAAEDVTQPVRRRCR
jgi:hypothetical protein